MTMRNILIPRLSALACCALLAGCTGGGGPTGNVSGEVKFNGKPLPAGYISFKAADNQPDAGASVTDGKYSVKNVPAGPKVVHIDSAGSSAKSGPMSSEEASKMKGGAASDAVPANATGNNTKMEVKPGDQSFNFDLATPKG